MAENQKMNKQRDLESGDNPGERKRTSGKTSKEQDKGKDSRDLESGDNPAERRRSSGR